MTRQLSHNEAAFRVRRANEGRANQRAEANRRHHGERQSKLLAQTNVAQRNADGMRFYGRQWTEVMGILVDYAGDGRGERASQGTRADCRAGGEAGNRELKEEQRDMGLILKSVEIQIGEKPCQPRQARPVSGRQWRKSGVRLRHAAGLAIQGHSVACCRLATDGDGGGIWRIRGQGRADRQPVRGQAPV